MSKGRDSVLAERISLAALEISRSCCVPARAASLNCVFAILLVLQNGPFCVDTLQVMLRKRGVLQRWIGKTQFALNFSVISPFCFFIVINWETNRSMEKCMTCWLFMSWQEKKCLFLCLDPFFSYHVKEKRDYISLESGKTDVFAAVYYCGKVGFFTWRFRWMLCKLVFT